ncbi:unannotated protein [freshwater metagenome]|uniref:Unannotated protein n=1 Tax=freshwater metagenome TaxID=449393 RepID=A0A6J7HJ51_9ZZZZ|nr:hypothetical protein [Actinomycetota bacterium]
MEAKDAAAQKAPSKITVANIITDGDKGTATVTFVGGDQGGATGPVTVVKENREWRIDDLSTELLRSEYENGLKNETAIAAPVRDCIIAKGRALGDEDFRNLGYGSMGDDKAALAQLEAIVTGCQEEVAAGGTQPSGDSATVEAIRTKIETQIAASLKGSGATAAQITCVQNGVRKAITDEDIAALIAKEGKVTQLPASIVAEMKTSITACLTG